MLVTSSITIDLTRKGFTQYLYATQDDGNTRAIEITLLADGQPWNIPASTNGAVSFKKPDKTSGLYDTLPDGATKAVTFVDNKLTAVLAPQVLTAAGDVDVSIALYDPSLNKLGTFPLVLRVEKNPSAGQGISNDYYNFQTLGELNEAIAAKASMEYTKKVGNPHNLLDNSDFRNPVNQRGQTSYAETGYTIDRWGNNAGLTVDVGKNGVTLTPNGSGKTPDFYQPIQYRSYLLGKKVTIAVGTNRGTFVVSGTIPTSVSGSANLAIGTVAFGQLRLQAVNSTYWLVNIYATSAVTVYWVALYEGEYTTETLPEYQPKGYAVELAECMRYYQKGDIPVFTRSWYESHKGSIWFYVPMRVIPTMVLTCGSSSNTISAQMTTINGCHFAATGETYLSSWEASAEL